jgi:anaerobic selenocysteine-containing dehydrogenase
VARVLLDRDAVDHEFIAKHVLGFDAYAAMIREHSAGEWADIADVPVWAVEKMADMLALSKPATICAGFGMQRYTNSGQTMRAIISLLAITGNLGRPGAGWIYANLQTQVFGGPRDPVAFFPPEEDDGAVRVGVSTARLGRDMMALDDPPLKFAWVERGNPLAQNPATLEVRQAFRALDFRVVVEQFMTDTAREADIVFPAKTMFEQSDVIGAYWHAYLQYRPGIMAPPGEVKPETEIYRALAGRLGIEIEDAIPVFGEEGPWLNARLAPLGLSLESFAEGPVAAPGGEDVAFADGVYPTPSGKVELLSDEAAARWDNDPLPRPGLPGETAAGGNTEFPLQMMTPNTKNRIHSQFGNLKIIRAYDRGPEVQIHPDDAAARDIAMGDEVRIFNDRGEITVPARIDAGIRRGCVAVTNGWWGTDGALVNKLSPGLETDVAHGAAFHDTVVEVAKA